MGLWWNSICKQGEPLRRLLLSPLYDRLFDIGLITFDDNMKVLISNKLSSENVSKINIDINKIYVSNPSNEMIVNMRYHRQNIFVG